ncbi:MAG: HAD-IA family hydrolase [Hyphomicrobiales bacterium]|nr:HAD-IA family hydrolase [Hyphomicrobiales bacterium]
MTPRLVIFDCDGTLADGQHMIVRAMATAFEAAGLPPAPREAAIRTIGLSPLECMRMLAPDETPAAQEALASGYRAAFQALRRTPDFAEPLFPGAKAALRAIAGHGALLAIATGKSQRGVRALLEREGLSALFTSIQTADDAPSKPHPGMVMNALAETGAAPSEAVMVGDSTYDIHMARAAGVAAVGVAWGYHPPEALAAAGASAVAADFSELLSLLGVFIAETKS